MHISHPSHACFAHTTRICIACIYISRDASCITCYVMCYAMHAMLMMRLCDLCMLVMVKKMAVFSAFFKKSKIVNLHDFGLFLVDFGPFWLDFGQFSWVFHDFWLISADFDPNLAKNRVYFGHFFGKIEKTHFICQAVPYDEKFKSR